MEAGFESDARITLQYHLHHHIARFGLHQVDVGVGVLPCPSLTVSLWQLFYALPEGRFTLEHICRLEIASNDLGVSEFPFPESKGTNLRRRGAVGFAELAYPIFWFARQMPIFARLLRPVEPSFTLVFIIFRLQFFFKSSLSYGLVGQSFALFLPRIPEST